MKRIFGKVVCIVLTFVLLIAAAPIALAAETGAPQDGVSRQAALEVTGLKAENMGFSKLRLTWNMAAGDGYQVYRSETEVGGYRSWRTIKSPHITEFIDGIFKTPKTYYYKVVAYKMVDGQRVRGKFSGPVSARPTDAKVRFHWIEVGTQPLSARLQWRETPAADGYEIHRSVNGGSYKLHAAVNRPAYTDYACEPGGTYAYKFRAYRDIHHMDEDYKTTITRQYGAYTTMPEIARL